MIFRSAQALCLALGVAAFKEGQSRPSWHQFGSNANYRLTAVLDVNGGAESGPNFESFTDEVHVRAGDATKSMRTQGYSVPVEVLTLRDDDGNYRQRVSYYNGMEVDYNDNGEGYKVVPAPFVGGGAEAESPSSTCFLTGGSQTDAKEKIGYLNFFPTVEQMEQYTLGKLITNEPGIPYRVATLEAPHGSHNATSTKWIQPDSSYGSHPGMPKEDWFQFHYEESLSPTSKASASRPLKWTMLARNQIINAHTENWVIRYLSYEAIDEDERKLWGNWFDSKFSGACGDGNGMDQFTLADAGRGVQLNRLGMFFSSSSRPPRDATALTLAASPAKEPSRFDLFLARHNKQHDKHEYARRKAIHDGNVEKIEGWNKEHAGKTKFAANEFLDLEAKEVMKFRGGHLPRGADNIAREDGKRNLRSKIPGNHPRFLLGEEDEEEYNFPTHQVPKDFDPSILPESFDWRDHLPGSVNPVKDQGFCGSCWAFSLVSALESHWFIAHSQTVVLPEQFVNDCAWSDYVHACDGGESAAAAGTIIDNFGGKVPTRDAYGGYLSADGGCYVDILQEMGMMGENNEELSSPKAQEISVTMTDWVNLPLRDDLAAKHALFTKGPLSVALNVVDEAMYYADGVLDVESCLENDAHHLDHAINLVGWGVDDLPDGGKAEHWILRNSWSDLWGDAGYFRVRMGERDCGVTTQAGYPVVLGPEDVVQGLTESVLGKVTATS